MVRRFRFECIESLPPLAWCAAVPNGDDEIKVVHGRWVETRAEAFFEGAWDGPFEDVRPDEATTFTGTGGRIEGDRLVFATPSAPSHCIYTKRTDAALWLSNSHVFLMVQTGDEPDPTYPYYGEDMLLHGLSGIWRDDRSLRTARGEILLHECANLVVTEHLQLVREEKPPAPVPSSYEHYVATLDDAVGRVIANAADPRRIHSYPPLVSLSRGYDSPCVAVLASRHGCKEAFTFAERAPGDRRAEHDASEIGIALGMNVTRHAMLELRERGGTPEAEFCTVPPGEMAIYASVEKRIAGTLLLAGEYGDRLWSTNLRDCAPDMQCDGTNSSLGGRSLGEFRLRVGFLRLTPLFLAREHGAAIHAISTSAALRPWSVGGTYDRPIARRLREEAGLPAHLFVEEKARGFVLTLRTPEKLSESSRRDFAAFVRTLPLARGARAQLRVNYAVFSRLQRLRRALRRTTSARRRHARNQSKGPVRALEVPQFYRLGLHRLLAHPTGAFLFQWGFARTCNRYVATK